MSTTLKIYDPLKAVKRMQKAGVQKDLAESIAEEIRESQDCIINDLATKNDLISEIALVRAEIKNAMLTTIISIGGIVVTAIGFVSWLFKMT